MSPDCWYESPIPIYRIVRKALVFSLCTYIHHCIWNHLLRSGKRHISHFRCNSYFVTLSENDCLKLSPLVSLIVKTRSLCYCLQLNGIVFLVSCSDREVMSKHSPSKQSLTFLMWEIEIEFIGPNMCSHWHKQQPRVLVLLNQCKKNFTQRIFLPFIQFMRGQDQITTSGDERRSWSWKHSTTCSEGLIWVTSKYRISSKLLRNVGFTALTRRSLQRKCSAEVKSAQINNIFK